MDADGKKGIWFIASLGLVSRLWQPGARRPRHPRWRPRLSPSSCVTFFVSTFFVSPYFTNLLRQIHYQACPYTRLTQSAGQCTICDQ